MPLETFLGCFEIETGGLIIGWLGLVVHIILILVLIIGLFSMNIACDQVSKNHGVDQCNEAKSVYAIFMTIGIILCLIIAFVSYKLIKGVEKCDSKSLKPARILYIVQIIFYSLRIFQSLQHMETFLMSMVSLITVIYSYMIIDALYRKFQQLPMHNTITVQEYMVTASPSGTEFIPSYPPPNYYNPTQPMSTNIYPPKSVSLNVCPPQTIPSDFNSPQSIDDKCNLPLPTKT